MKFLESTHPYLSDLDETQTCTVPGSPTTIWITFWPQTKTESGYDFIYVFDGADNPIGNPAGYSGVTLANVTLEVPGDTVKVRFTSDSSVEYYGYRATVSDTLPYPVRISENQYTNPLSQPSSRGPWVYGSSVYTVMGTWDTEGRISVFRSTDWGQTWAKVDDSNAPLDGGGFAYIASATRRGNSLYVLHFIGPITPRKAAIYEFDLTTNTWAGAAIATGGPSAAAVVTRSSLVSRSDGSFVLVAEVETGSNYNVQYATWSSAGGWSALANVASLYANQTRLRGGAFLGGADRVHVPLICGTTEMYFEVVVSTLTLAGALSDTATGIAVGYDYGSSGYAYAAKTYVVGGVTWFALPLNRTVAGAYQQPSHLLRAISADTVSEYWEEHVGVDPDPQPGQTNWNHAVMVGLDGHLYAFYGRMETYDITWSYATFFLARYSGTGAEKYDNSAGWVDDTAVYAWKPGDYSQDPEIGEVNGQIGVLYTFAGEQPWFGLWWPWAIVASIGCRYHGF